MSKELNIRGAFVGSGKYFQEINKSEVINEITNNLSCCLYNEFLVDIGIKSYCVIEDIYKDLSKNQLILNFIPSTDREQLIKFISQIDTLLKYAGKIFIKSHRLSFFKNNKSYVSVLKSGFQSIAKKIELDICLGLRNNDYIQDENAKNKYKRGERGHAHFAMFLCTASAWS